MKKFVNANTYGNPESTETLVEDGRFKTIGTGPGEGHANISGTLFEGIQRRSDKKKSLTEEMVRESALEGIHKEVSHGVQYIRTHVDVTDPDLTGMKALIKLREELKDIVTLQLVAFPQEGFFRYEGGEYLFKHEVRKNEIENEFLKV